MQGFFGHVMGGMGAISDAIAASGQAHGMQIRTGAPVARIRVTGGAGARGHAGRRRGADRPGWCCPAPTPSGPSCTLVDQAELPEEFRAAVAGITMDGPCAKVNLVLDAEPQVRGMPADAGPGPAGAVHPAARPGRGRRLLRPGQAR